jgi:hypothetical protein
MRRSVVALSLFASSTAVAQKQPVSNGRIAGEIAAGVVGVPLGFAAGYTLGSGLRPHGSSNTGAVGGLVGALVGPATAVNWVGNGGPSHGNFGVTIAGTAVGYGAAYLVFPIVNKVPGTKLKAIAFLAAATLPAVGATIAYNSTRK